MVLERLRAAGMHLHPAEQHMAPKLSLKSYLETLLSSDFGYNCASVEDSEAAGKSMQQSRTLTFIGIPTAFGILTCRIGLLRTRFTGFVRQGLPNIREKLALCGTHPAHPSQKLTCACVALYSILIPYVLCMTE